MTLFILALGVASSLINYRYKYLQKKVEEKNVINKRITDLKLASLRAQMNPHFIFNCLNSIQHFILKNDIAQTNRYITKFSNLIRQTLDNSGKVNISVSDEMNYLISYIELEQMRFSSKFQYIISIGPDIQTDYMFIPSLLFQPFVENSIRHGIRYKKTGTGLIKITITQTSSDVLFTIEDNGIGMEAARRYRSVQHIEYQSKGITLTQDRLETLNSVDTEKITCVITDLKDESLNSRGTKVTISFPKSIIEKLN